MTPSQKGKVKTMRSDEKYFYEKFEETKNVSSDDCFTGGHNCGTCMYCRWFDAHEFEREYCTMARKMFKYGMRLRGAAPGAQPKDGLERILDDPSGKYWNILCYGRELTAKEIRDYELEPVTETSR